MRVASWNTLWRFGNWEPRQPLLRDVLVGLEPDAVLLQETWPDQASGIAEALGFEVLVFGGGTFDQELSSVPDDELFGNAILARSGSVVVDHVFSGLGDPAPRRLLAAEVDGRVLATTHLTHMAEAGAERRRQLDEITQRLSGEADRYVLAGDCNLVPISAEYRHARSLGLVDVWPTLQSDFGATMVPANPEIEFTEWMDERNGDSAPPGTGIRIDYVWAFGGAEVSGIERFGSVEGPRWPSDHLGLVFDLGS